MKNTRFKLPEEAEAQEEKPLGNSLFVEEKAAVSPRKIITKKITEEYHLITRRVIEEIHEGIVCFY